MNKNANIKAIQGLYFIAKQLLLKKIPFILSPELKQLFENFKMRFNNVVYSWNLNKRAGPNKRAGLQISENSINVQG